MTDKIEIGDRVNIFFGRSNAIFDAEVLYTPSDTGDSWRLKTKEKENHNYIRIEHIHYVQQFERMDKL